ncbi:PmoA family protein [Lacipirellula parvula]|uniref:DUF6807 domain-containing protein n=1 Tax=Lacipirellula parvula TaxID=2650471 RepID=UPI001562A28E|nr:PmoA family protein [Lacipirellula parvula]
MITLRAEHARAAEAPAADKTQPVVASLSADRATITVAGEPFAVYQFHSGHQPVVWPIVGPAGEAMTRQYPFDAKLPTEQDDHPHHRSLWFNHGSVNGLDFWMEPEAGDKGPQIVQRTIVVQDDAADDASACLVTTNDWMNSGKKVCEDLRRICFSTDAEGRWIDFTVTVKASDGELLFGDTKEGSFGIRVPGEFDVDAKRGGQIRNSHGQVDGDAWGRSAEWVDYHGTIDGKPAGIVVFDMPDSFRHPTRWHVRTYGLFAANPFGNSDFPAGDSPQGEVRLAPGDELTLHYRVLFYSGKRTAEQIGAIYREITAKPTAP